MDVIQCCVMPNCPVSFYLNSSNIIMLFIYTYSTTAPDAVTLTKDGDLSFFAKQDEVQLIYSTK